MKNISQLLALALACLLAASAAAQTPQSPQALCDAAQPAELSMMQFAQTEEVLDPTLDYRAIFCTSAGAIYLDLYEELTPITVNNFVFLAQQGYYDNTSFHRVIPDFMAQGGDPTATGRGGPGYQFQDEPVGFLTFNRPGLLAMANAGPGTNGSQFFITTAPTPHLNYKHTIFGDVLEGQERVVAIRERDPQTASEAGEALHTVLILTEPALVDSTEMALAQATAEEVGAAFARFTANLPPTLTLDEGRTGYFSTADLAATVSEPLQDGFADFADAHGHQYRQRMQLENSGCDESVFFSALGFWVDVFADAESASAAASDDFMQLWLDSYDYERAADTPNIYRHYAETCDGAEGLHLLSLNARGRYLATIDVLVAASMLDQVPAAALMQNLSLQLEGAVASVFQGEIRKIR